MGFFIRLFFCGIIVSGLGLWFMRALEFSDLYNVVHKNVPGPCKFVQGIDLGAEDISVLPNGLAIMSTGLMVPTESGGKPALKSFDFSKPEQPARDLTLSGFKGDLMPHGLSLYSTNGKTFVYVVNHPAGLLNGTGEDEVLKFLWQTDKQTLMFQKSFKDPEFRSLNDLVVVGDDKFYVTNWFTMKSPIMRQLEAILFVLPLQNVVYFDGKAGTVVLSGKYGANGINASPDKKYVITVV
ncbi:hypothetical protein RvY_05702-2 [Ramazzottius varieornatus]|uniref:Adipocyte plasma membrane-associated protein n=1 Tax=Ramazzottius varieornatus TaxID=947166 RepID=A0A1D1UWG7_RAMVA|nr:hypothetical protein RvY_05702-2 [Ramazzottius varieornatus]